MRLLLLQAVLYKQAIILVKGVIEAMYELSRDLFYKALPLIENGHQHPEIQSILENNNSGWIFTDRIDSPRTALVWSRGMRGFYLIGDERNVFTRKLDGFITTSIAPRMKEFGMHYFEVSGHHNKWNLNSIFASRELHTWDQIVFGPPKSDVPSQESSSNYHYRTVNLRSKEWRENELLNRGFVNAHIDLFWDTHEDFYSKGYGYAAVDGDEIIGVCYSSFVTKEKHAIGIETLPKHHRRGVGTCLANLVMNDIVENGCSPYWDCSWSNEASKNLALRLGLKQIHQYQCVGFTL